MLKIPKLMHVNSTLPAQFSISLKPFQNTQYGLKKNIEMQFVFF